jgi:hypothetical protein
MRLKDAIEGTKSLPHTRAWEGGRCPHMYRRLTNGVPICLDCDEVVLAQEVSQPVSGADLQPQEVDDNGSS